MNTQERTHLALDVAAKMLGGSVGQSGKLHYDLWETIHMAATLADPELLSRADVAVIIACWRTANAGSGDPAYGG